MSAIRRLLVLGGILAAAHGIAPAAAQQQPGGAPPGEAQTARGMIEPRTETTLSSQIAARIARLPVDRGQRVAKGDLLVSFDCALERARLKAAEADLAAARARLASLRRLDQMGSIGRADVQVAEAEQDKAAAVVDERRAIAGYCTVNAPFDGVVTEVEAHANDSVAAGTPLLSLLDERSLRIVILAPSHWTGWVVPDMPLTFTVDETGEALPGRVSHLGARIDATSQTIPVFAVIDRKAGGSSPPLIAGMTGTASIEPPAASR